MFLVFGSRLNLVMLVEGIVLLLGWLSVSIGIGSWFWLIIVLILVWVSGLIISCVLLCIVC